MLVADEDEFYRSALLHPEVREDFRRFILTVAEDEVVKISRGVAVSDEMTTKRLLDAAMKPFDRAFDLYVKRFPRGGGSYQFSTYYRWWARQYATKALLDE